MNLITYKQLVEDVKKWSSHLPKDYDAIVGVERSGLLPATILALEMNKPLLTLNTLINGANDYIDSKVSIGKISKILVVDDSISSGRAMQSVRNVLEDTDYSVEYCAVYGLYSNNKLIDYKYKNVELPRVFEWNLFHHNIMKESILDIDGVIFQEPPIEDNTQEYEAYLRNPKPLHTPSVPVLGIVTGRLEKYRDLTERSLKDNGIEYGFLEMAQYNTPQERRMHNMGEYKAEIYKKTQEAKLFVESSKLQAIRIRTMSAKPVICIEEL